jgi:Protein of unknown function (DUF3108)
VSLSLKLPWVFSSAILLLLLFDPVLAQRKSEPLPFSSEPYKVGERLTYDISFSNFISVAHVELQVGARGIYAGRQGIQLRAHVETTGVVNAALFAINNDYVSYVDPETGLPFRTQQILRDTVRAPDLPSNSTEPTGAVRQRDGGFSDSYDLVSAIYRLRAMPLSEGSTFRLTVKGDNDEEYQAEVKINGTKALKTSVGSFNTLVAQVHVANNSRIDGYKIRIYFSDDDRHIPVLLTARHSAGEIRAELAGSDFVAPPVAPPPPKAAPTPIAATSPTPTSSVRQPVSDSDSGPNNLPFKVGEQLNYQIFLGASATPVGSASFQVRARSRYFDRDGFLLAVRAQTAGAVARLFAADDRISTYVDPRTLLPFRCEMTLNEGKRHVSQILNVNQDHGVATTSSGQRLEIPVGTHDYISFFYALRTFSLAPPKRNAVSMLVENKPKTIFISSLRRESIQLGSERIPAIAVSITTDDAQSDKFVLRGWISDDNRRLPLRLTAQTELGPIRVDLVILPLTAQ